MKILFLIIIAFTSCRGFERKEKGFENKLAQSTELKQPTSTFCKEKFDCYTLSLKWNYKDSRYIDTIVSVRNYLNNDSNKKVICDSKFIDLQCESLIYNCKYISNYLMYLERLNNFAMLSYSQLDSSKTVAHFYLVGKSDLKVVEMQSFLISKEKIIGMKMFSFVSEFTPIGEFEIDGSIGPDPNELDNTK
jgi:hypothetical protein